MPGLFSQLDFTPWAVFNVTHTPRQVAAIFVEKYPNSTNPSGAIEHWVFESVGLVKKAPKPSNPSEDEPQIYKLQPTVAGDIGHGVNSVASLRAAAPSGWMYIPAFCAPAVAK